MAVTYPPIPAVYYAYGLMPEPSLDLVLILLAAIGGLTLGLHICRRYW